MVEDGSQGRLAHPERKMIEIFDRLHLLIIDGARRLLYGREGRRKPSGNSPIEVTAKTANLDK
jgi:hypothetical protein